MARGGGQIIDARGRAPQPVSPFEGIGQGLSALGQIFLQQQQLSAYLQQIQQTRANQMQARAEQDAQGAQALAQLLATGQPPQPTGPAQPLVAQQAPAAPTVTAPQLPRPGGAAAPPSAPVLGQVPTTGGGPGLPTPQRDASLQAMFDASVAQQSKAGQKALKRGEPNQVLLQAPIALKTAQAERARNVALSELDRRAAEVGSNADPTLAGTRDATLSALQGARAQIEAGADPSQVATLMQQLGADPTGQLAFALNTEKLKGVQDARAADEAATSYLQEQGVLPAGVPRMPGAAATLLNLRQASEETRLRETSELKLIGAREAADTRGIARREASNKRLALFENNLKLRSNALAAYDGFLQMAYGVTKDPSEAQAQALRMLAAQNPELAAELRKSGRADFVARVAGARLEASGYLQTLLERNLQMTTAPVTREGSIGAFTGEPATVRGTVQRALPIDAKILKGQLLDHVTLTMGLDRQQATLLLNSMGVDRIIEGYNKGARAGLIADLSPQEAQAVLRDNLQRALQEPPEDANWFVRAFDALKSGPNQRKAVQETFGGGGLRAGARTPEVQAQDRAAFWRALDATNRAQTIRNTNRGAGGTF